jgi:hypothetical protein
MKKDEAVWRKCAGAAGLRAAGQLPQVRDFSREQVEAWIADDEEGTIRSCSSS